MMGMYWGGLIPPSHISSSNEILIQFQSDGSVTRAGFQIEYNPLGNRSIKKPLNIIELFAKFFVPLFLDKFFTVILYSVSEYGFHAKYRTIIHQIEVNFKTAEVSLQIARPSILL